MLTGADVAVIIVALITSTASVVGAILSAKKSKDEMVEKLNETLMNVNHESQLSDERLHSQMELILQDVSNLREEVRKHNNVIERTYKLERDMEVLNTRVAQNVEDIADLKQK